MTSLVASQTASLAKALCIASDDPAALIGVLKATAFKGQVSDAQMTALLVVANQYGLNPWTKEIYAFPDRNNGIVPVVGVDGWSRIINSHPQFDGMDFEQDEDSCTCVIYRKDRKYPVKVTEYMVECRRDGVGPWKSHPKRMLRHKAMIQCARLAFGFVGIYEQDEAERIVEAEYVQVEPTPEEKAEHRKAVHDEALARHKESVDFIKERIQADDMAAAAQEWADIPQQDQMALWLAPTKGGYLTTEERKRINDERDKQFAEKARNEEAANAAAEAKAAKDAQ